MKLTPWYPGHVKPVRVGVYSRDFGDCGGTAFSKWDGKQWNCGDYDWEVANRDREPSSVQSLPWRGIAKEPK